jgi:preprotein translocase subunit YajC
VPLSSYALTVLADTTSPSPSGHSGGSSALNFLPLLLIVFVGYLLLVRPARQRQRKALQNRAALEPGATVTTTAGLLATVVAVDDDVVTLEVAPGVHSRYLKGAIARVHPTDLPEPIDDDGAGSTGSTTLDTVPEPTGMPETVEPTTEVPPATSGSDPTEH